jgi:nucleoside-diphosphate-sugar epimerase
LRALWQAGAWKLAAAPVWQSRSKDDHTDLHWDVCQTAAPEVRCNGIIVLAGVTQGTAEALARNSDIALAACDLADRLGGVRVLIASSQAVYGAQTGKMTEASSCAPVNAYGHAKLAMEIAVSGRTNVTCLRLGNVAGAGQPFTAMEQPDPIRLDRFSDGQGPRRAMIGPLTLAQVLTNLLDHKGDLPAILNVASPGLVAMEDILDAAGGQWAWADAADTALPELSLDVKALLQIMPLPPASAALIVAEARLAGWRGRHDRS